MENILRDLERIMVEYGLVIRAIPYERTAVLEVRHKDRYPNGIIRYREDFKRDMLHVVESNGELGGKFFIAKCNDTSSTVKFSGKRFDTLEEAINSILRP